jgi:hypothetical protein
MKQHEQRTVTLRRGPSFTAALTLMFLLPLALCTASLFHPARAAEASVSTALQSRVWTVDLPAQDAKFRQTLLATQVEAPRLVGPLDLRAHLPVAWSRDDELDTEVTGPGDAQLRLMWPSAAAGWSLNLGCDLPTGQTGLTVDEALLVSRMLASRVLDFGLKRPGEGLDLMLGASKALPVGRNTIAGVALAGYLKGDYALYEGNGREHRAFPGNRLHAAISLLAREHPQDPNWDLDLTLGVQVAGQYELETEGAAARTTIDEGAQGSLDARYRRRAGDDAHFSLSLYLLAHDRNRVSGASAVEVEMLGLSTRSVTELGLGYERAWPPIGDLSIDAAHSLFRTDPTSSVNSRVTALSLALRHDLSAHLQVSGSAGYAFGKTPWPDATVPGNSEQRNLSGTTAGVAIRIAF